MKSIEVKNAAINQAQLEEQLANTLAQIPDNLNLATSGSVALQDDYLQEGSASDIIQPLIKYIPDTILQEPKFTSTAPVIGSLIVAVRNAWNWMSTKWYVLPILIQQSIINADLIMFLVKSAQFQENQEKRIIELEARIAQLETQLQQNQE